MSFISLKLESVNQLWKNFQINIHTIDGKDGFDTKWFLSNVQSYVIRVLKDNTTSKVNIVLTCIMERLNIPSGLVTTSEAPFHSKTETVLESTDLSSLYQNASNKMLESMDSFQMRGSNWRFKSVLSWMLILLFINY